jgi:hypothetical protein
LNARLTTLLWGGKKVTKSKEEKTGCNLAESSKEGYGKKKGAVLPMMMMMIIYTLLVFL